MNIVLIENKEEAAAFISYYKDLAAEDDITELKTFCKTFDNWLPYILNYYDYTISNGPVEGDNHKILSCAVMLDGVNLLSDTKVVVEP
jgi:transposase